MSTVITNGCFDLFHEGHLNFFRRLQNIVEYDTRLIVFINHDESVARLKPGRPIQPYSSRASMVQSVVGEMFSDVTIVGFSADNCAYLMKRDHEMASYTYAKDMESGVDGPEALMAKSMGCAILSIPRLPGVSTTNIIERIRNAHQAGDAGSGRDPS